LTKAQLERFENVPDDNIDTSIIPELDEHFWSNAKLVLPPNKQAISIRIDSDVLEWFKNNGKGYQSLMNSVLRSYMDKNARD
jgi:uncharacterized protein (DUF4415 family)